MVSIFALPAKQTKQTKNVYTERGLGDLEKRASCSWYQLPSSHGTSSSLPACEFDGQYEQRAEHDSPTEESRPPGHQEQHLAERLSHPAQHYSQSSARRPIYTPRSKLDTYIRATKKAWWAKAGSTGEQTVVLSWIGRGRCWCPGHSNTVTPTFLSHVDFFHFRKNDSKGATAKCRATVCQQGVEFISFVAFTLMANARLAFLKTTSIIIQMIVVFGFSHTKCACAFYVFAFFFATAPQCKYDGRRTPTVTRLGKQTRPYCWQGVTPVSNQKRGDWPMRRKRRRVLTDLCSTRTARL